MEENTVLFMCHISSAYRTARSFKFVNLDIGKLFGISKLGFEI